MPLATLEAVVTAIMDNSAILQISETGQEIAWPLNDEISGTEIEIGDSFTVYFQPTPVQSVKNIVTAAKKEQNSLNRRNGKSNEQNILLQKTLEALIN